MKRRMNLGMMPGIVVAITLLTALLAEAVVVNFPDKNLEAAVRKAINKPTGDIQQSDLVGTGFTQFYPNDWKIRDLTGLEYCKDLTGLGFMGNRMSDLSALAALTNLEWLSLQANRTSDISSLTALTNLRDLRLDSNRISDITALAGLPNLTHLALGGNPIRGLGSRIAQARIECRIAWRALGATEQALLAVGLPLLVAVLVTLRRWSRRVSKRYTEEP